MSVLLYSFFTETMRKVLTLANDKAFYAQKPSAHAAVFSGTSIVAIFIQVTVREFTILIFMVYCSISYK